MALPSFSSSVAHVRCGCTAGHLIVVVDVVVVIIIIVVVIVVVDYRRERNRESVRILKWLHSW